MYIDYSTWETFEYKVSSLQLDINNPRIRYMGDNLNQIQVLKILLEKEKIYELKGGKTKCDKLSYST